MSWVTEKVKQEYEARAAVPPPPQPYSPPSPAWWPVWEAINAATKAAVREFNQAQGSEQFRGERVADQVRAHRGRVTTRCTPRCDTDLASDERA